MSRPGESIFNAIAKILPDSSLEPESINAIRKIFKEKCDEIKKSGDAIYKDLMSLNNKQIDPKKTEKFIGDIKNYPGLSTEKTITEINKAIDEYNKNPSNESRRNCLFQIGEPLKLCILFDKGLEEQIINNIAKQSTPDDIGIYERAIGAYDNDKDKQSAGAGGKHKYKGRSYKIREGSRGGKYIMVSGKRIYV
jgi:hypothetical protein